MNIGQAIKEVDKRQQNTAAVEDKIKWLRQLDMEIWNDVILTHEGWEDYAEPSYTEETDMDTELIVPSPYDCIYTSWLQSRIDYDMAEYTRFNNSNATFEADRIAFRNWWNRTHLPLSAGGRYF